ncbi:uncharacterized protein LOC119682351 [Teleopsis dalmanni]|uniref:uncharacterized protein LOC119682351 n=1 Tax=Teleopsis dalmanni TaxID=139649 RepID=UPI000D32BA5E|nr:uncharacterized protein LOC119682351 [Teleopsis dalmanni]
MSLMCTFVVVLIVTLFSQQLKANDVQTTNTGPVTGVMESLAYNVASITDELNLELGSKIERTSSSLLGNMEVVIANAMSELSTPIYEADQKLTSGTCELDWSMNDLRKRIDGELQECTQDISEIMQAFESDAAGITSALQTFIDEIVNLPVVCNMLTTFSSSTNCFVNRMADINIEIGKQLKVASNTLLRTRQLTQSSVAAAEKCTSNMVAGTQRFLTEEMAKC